MSKITFSHPELVSGSIPNLASALAARWMLKHVQHDGVNAKIIMSLIPSPFCMNPILCHTRAGEERSDRKFNPSPELSVKVFRAKAQRRQGIALRLCVFARTKIGLCYIKPLPFRGGVGVGPIHKRSDRRTAPTPLRLRQQAAKSHCPSPKEEGGNI
jgi:hypothetical protein